MILHENDPPCDWSLFCYKNKCTNQYITTEMRSFTLTETWKDRKWILHNMDRLTVTVIGAYNQTISSAEELNKSIQSAVLCHCQSLAVEKRKAKSRLSRTDRRLHKAAKYQANSRGWRSSCFQFEVNSLLEVRFLFVFLFKQQVNKDKNLIVFSM